VQKRTKLFSSVRQAKEHAYPTEDSRPVLLGLVFTGFDGPQPKAARELGRTNRNRLACPCFTVQALYLAPPARRQRLWVDSGLDVAFNFHAVSPVVVCT